MRQPHQTCETCQHCAKVATGKLAGKLECRVRPPIVAVVGEYPRTLWPEVYHEHWCGEWGPK